jgi:methanogenic corrinoid protein MtbC1
MSSHAAAASIIEKNAADIAHNACSHLLSHHADIGKRFGEDAQQLWTDHLTSRTMELSAALAMGDPDMFASRLTWSRTAMRARNITPEDLYSSLDSLRAGILGSLEGPNLRAALDCIDRAQKALQDKREKPDVTTIPSQLDAGLEHDKLALSYVQTVVAGNVLHGTQLILDAVGQGMLIRDAYLRVLLPAQQEVGRLWHLNEISIAEEHLVSYTTQRVMALLSTRVPHKPDNGYTVVAGSVAGNAHDIGIRAITYLMEFEGWRTIYLGSDIPRQELPAILHSYEADLLMLSVALTTQLTSTRRAIEEIRANPDSAAVKILIGGNGLRDQPDSWRELGANGYAPGALEALEKALELVSG